MRVCFDACVLYPTVLREILVGCAGEGLYAPLWSARILEEWARATVKLGPGAEDVARGEIARLRSEWPAAEVVPRAGDLDRLSLPDPDDVHVLAAAIAGSADLLCTFNARDFPKAALSEEGIVRVDPDQLLRQAWPGEEAGIRRVIERVHAEAERLSGERIELRGLLKRARLPRLAKLVGR
ncbi:PIN domain-containing protein [Palleronia aestuarii]|uniref:PIN domain-containing protein n=1 Tax=Palleronia aestuarii TaxID=568105 RepID=A0A2W7NKB1_9RHOB|nr:PIN domain-containing protein [Palleronia aestuarii]PZX18527.1 PIN domain-containing protein [Palleronia aestuarii]